MNQTNLNNRDKYLHIFLLISVIAVFVWSFVNCFDVYTWVLESSAVVIGAGIIILLYHKFRLTNLCYVLIFIHAVILLIGAHYTYAKVPLFDLIADSFNMSRNHYDRLGHFAQGFVPAIIAREILLRTSPLRRGKWLFFLIVCVCMAISAGYELLEWAVAAVSEMAADAFLGTQGDTWDTQKDMFMCLVGAITSLIVLGNLHDKSLKNVKVASRFNIVSDDKDIHIQ